MDNYRDERVGMDMDRGVKKRQKKKRYINQEDIRDIDIDGDGDR